MRHFYVDLIYLSDQMFDVSYCRLQINLKIQLHAVYSHRKTTVLIICTRFISRNFLPRLLTTISRAFCAPIYAFLRNCRKYHRCARISHKGFQRRDADDWWSIVEECPNRRSAPSKPHYEQSRSQLNRGLYLGSKGGLALLASWTMDYYIYLNRSDRSRNTVVSVVRFLGRGSDGYFTVNVLTPSHGEPECRASSSRAAPRTEKRASQT